MRDYPLGLQVGDHVRVLPATSTRPLKAVVYAFIIPLLLLATEAILLSSLVQLSETTLLLIMLGTLITYALILRALRGYFEKAFQLTAVPLKELKRETTGQGEHTTTDRPEHSSI